MKIAITVLGVAMVLYSILVRIPRDRFGGLRLIGFWLALTASVWVDQPWLVPLAIVLIAWPMATKALGLVGLGDPVKGIDVALGADFYRDRERGIRRAVELATPEAWSVLVAHLANVDAGEDEEELMAIFRGLVDGWGAQHVADQWDQYPAQAKVDVLEFARGSQQFKPEEVLVLSRRGMDDEHETIARASWRTYAYTVTTGVELGRGDFDCGAWLRETAEDPNKDVQELRARLEEKRLALLQTQGLDALVARYRAEVFKAIRPTAMELSISGAQRLQSESGETLELAVGTHAGQLSGKVDSAQDAVNEGWSFVFELKDTQGRPWRIESVWFAEDFFGEILESQHDANRPWFDAAPEELERAFSLSPLVGPVVAYGDAWELYAPKVEGEELQPVKDQVLSCLIANVPGQGGQPARLGFLLYEVEDAAQGGDDRRPFVTIIDLERLLFAGEGEVRVQLLQQPESDTV